MLSVYACSARLDEGAPPNVPATLPRVFREALLQRLQVLDQVAFLLILKPQQELRVVVLDDLAQGGKAAVVEEPALLMRPQSRERRGAVHMGGRAVGLEGIDPDLRGRMKVLTRLRKERRNVAGCALALVIEDFLAARRRRRVEAADRGLRRLERQLISMKRGKLPGDEIRSPARIPRAAPGGHRILNRIAQARVEEGSRAVHLRHRDIGVPVR